MAELNEPACCSASSLSDRFTTVSSDEDVEDSGEDASKSSSRTSAEPESVLSRLKAPDRRSLSKKEQYTKACNKLQAYGWERETGEEREEGYRYS